MKNLKESYTFLAIFHNKGDLGYSISFPNFDECFTYADTFEHGVSVARDVLEFYVYGRVEDGDKLPIPLTKDDIDIDDEDTIVIEVVADMTRYKENLKKNPIDREEYIPNWLIEIAEKNKEHLGVEVLNSLIIELKKDLDDN